MAVNRQSLARNTSPIACTGDFTMTNAQRRVIFDRRGKVKARVNRYQEITGA
jgi:hypothetical protein